MPKSSPSISRRSSNPKATKPVKPSKKKWVYRDLHREAEIRKANKEAMEVRLRRLKKPSPMDIVSSPYVTPQLIEDLTRIANDPERSTVIRVKAARRLLNLGY